ncbi:MAG TPA: DUF4403 family protein [Novosphingobium sp.]|nr:DUF4403 family protein [Novosphingobium sp.]
MTIVWWSRNTTVEPPPRVNDPVEGVTQTSLIGVPIETDVSALSQAFEKAIPHTLWTINQNLDRCVPARRVRLLGKSLKVTPDIGCTVIGTATRGPIRLRGEGEDIIADIPIIAHISARNVGGVLKGETATGAAMAHARVRLTLRQDWTPSATVRLAYDWTTAPGIDFLGRRITFTDKADERLQPIVRELERTLPREIARLDVRTKVKEAWRQSFTSLKLNDHNPPVWMRVTPQRLSYGGYSIGGGKLRLRLGMEAATETFVGQRPSDPTPTPLPQLTREVSGGQLRFFIPVVADYAQLEPVVFRALTRRAQRPFNLSGIGPVMARFDKVVAYGTTGGRIAMGITLAAKPAGSSDETAGVVWISARPVTQPGSQQVSFTDLEVRGNTNGVGGDILVQIANSPALAGSITEALTQNFTRDFQALLGKVRRAIVEKREGEFVIRAEIGRITTGRLRAVGQGLYLPVWAEGTARVEYVPH